MSYEGWKNRNTWSVALWINNEEPTYRYWKEAAGWARAASGGLNATFRLADRLRDEIGEQAPALKGMWSDIMTAALADVDWPAIAKDLLAE